MFAARANQENAIYEQQQAAAAKPLNQGIKGLAPKTPSNKPPKTPFGKARNDENARLSFGKTAGKDGKPERNAFITPANPRPRAPLGNKTTNAKAFQTPAPLLGPTKGKEQDQPASTEPGSPRLRRSKIKVHESGSAETGHGVTADTEEREIEYMPPREVPLPDTFEEFWPHECEFPVLRGQDLTRGWWSEFAPRKDEDEPDLSDYEEKCRKAKEHKSREAEAKKVHASKNAASANLKSGPSSAASQSAAAALSSRSTKSTSFSNAPSASAKARQPASAASVGKKPIFDRANPRFTAAKAASKSTIGYSRGRVVSSSRRPLSDIHAATRSSTHDERVEKPTPLDHLLSLGGLDITDQDAHLGFSSSNSGLDLLIEDSDEGEVFQLDSVEDA